MGGCEEWVNAVNLGVGYVCWAGFEYGPCGEWFVVMAAGAGGLRGMRRGRGRASGLGWGDGECADGGELR